MADSPLTVALIASSYHPHIGGVEQHTAQVAAGLLARGHRVEVWTVARDGIAGVREVEGVTVRDLPAPLPRMSLAGVAGFAGRFPLAMRHWMHACRALRPDVLHVQCFGPNGIYAQILSRLMRKPLVVSSHGETVGDDHNVFDTSLVLRRGLSRAVTAATIVTGCAPSVARDLEARFGATDVGVVPNGVHLAGDRGGPRLPTPHRRLIAAAGRLEHNKGFDLLIKALPQLPSDTRLTVIGDGSQRAALLRLAEELGVAARVDLPGVRRPEEVMEVFRAADVVVVPSRMESFGIVVLEGWAVGTPVVATSLAGPADFMTDGVDGLLVDPTDSDALASAVGSILADDKLWRRLSEGGWSAVQGYTWAQVVTDYVRSYRGLPVV